MTVTRQRPTTVVEGLLLTHATTLLYVRHAKVLLEYLRVRRLVRLRREADSPEEVLPVAVRREETDADVDKLYLFVNLIRINDEKNIFCNNINALVVLGGKSSKYIRHKWIEYPQT